MKYRFCQNWGHAWRNDHAKMSESRKDYHFIESEWHTSIKQYRFTKADSLKTPQPDKITIPFIYFSDNLCDIAYIHVSSPSYQ